MKYISLKNDYDLKVSSYITDLIDAEYIYVPITDLKTIKIKSNDYVYKGQELANMVYSPVSGNIIGLQECCDVNNQKFKCLVIKNDGKERFKTPKLNRKTLNDYTLKEVEDILVKYNINILNDLKNILVVNALEDEIYVANKVMLLAKKADVILETLDFLRKIFNIQRVYLVLKNNDSESVQKIISNVGRYPNIKLKLVPNYYGLEDNLNLKNFLFKNEKNLSFIDVKDLILIYNLVKNEKITTKKYITVSGLGVKKPKVLNVKIGTAIADVLKKVSLKKDDKYIVIGNGLMKGKMVDVTKLIVTDKLESIFIMPRQDRKVQPCINCGLCYECCPRGLNPKYLNELKNIPIKYQDICNGCNLCSYVCPANISLNIKGDYYE